MRLALNGGGLRFPLPLPEILPGGCRGPAKGGAARVQPSHSRVRGGGREGHQQDGGAEGEGIQSAGGEVVVIRH